MDPVQTRQNEAIAAAQAEQVLAYETADAEIPF